MTNFYIKLVKKINLQSYDIAESIAFNGNTILISVNTGKTVYTISNSGIVLNEKTLTTPIDSIAYDFSTGNILGYDGNNSSIITIYDTNFNSIDTISLNFDTSKFIPLKNMTYNLQNDTINLTYPSDLNTINMQGDITNNIHITRSKYHSSNISGAYSFSSITNNGRNYVVKTDLSNNLISYYVTPKNMVIRDFSIISSNIYRTNYYALGFLDGKSYILSICFSQLAPEGQQPIVYPVDNSLNNPFPNTGSPTQPTPFSINATQGGITPSMLASGISALTPLLFNRTPQSFAFGGGNQSSLSQLFPCGTYAAFAAFIYFLLCNGDSNTLKDCKNIELMIAIIILIYCYKCGNKKNDRSNKAKDFCCTDVCEQAFWENVNSYTISENNTLPYNYNLNDYNPVI